MAELQHREPEWIPSAPVHVDESRRIQASASDVWAIIADHERWPDWFTSIDVVKVTGASDAVGGRREVTISRSTVGEVFTAWTPERQFAFCVVRGPRLLAAMAESVTIDDADDTGCTVRYQQGVELARGFGWLSKPLAKKLRSELGKALDALAARAES